MAMWRETGDALQRTLAKAPDAPKRHENAVLRARIERMSEFLVAFERFLGDTSRARPSPPRARRIAITVDEEDAS
jgi:hypothetical protein